MTANEIRAFCERFARALEREDVAALAACYTDDCQVRSPLFHTLHGRAQVENSFRDLFLAFSDLMIEIDDVIVDCERDERAVLMFTQLCTHRGEIFGVPGTGRRIEVSMAFIFAFENGRIAKDTRLYDFTGMLVQLGILKARPA